MIKKIRNNIFFKNSILYTIGSMMTPMIGFIMLPVYTNYLDPSEYGTMTTIQTIVGMLKILMILSLKGAVTRFFYDFLNNESEQKKYLGSIFTFVFIFSIFISGLMLLFYKPIGNIFFDQILLDPFYFYLIVLSWLSGMISLPLALIRAQERATLFIGINITKAILIMIMTSYFIINLELGAESALISQIAITLMMVIITWAYSFKYFDINFNVSYIKTSLYFSVPLIPHASSGWIIQASDRIILEKFVSLSELGIYALAAQVSMVLSIFYTSLNNALVPRYTRLRKEGLEEDALELLKNFKKIVLVIGALSFPVAIVGTYLLTDPDYSSVIYIIPLLLVGQIIRGLYFIPVARLFYYKSTKHIATSSTIAALLNIIVNFSLIPLIGIYGAIISTIASEFLRTYLMSITSKSLSVE